MARLHPLARLLATAFLSGPWTGEELARRGALVYPSTPKRIFRLAIRVLTKFGLNAPLPCHRELAAFLEAAREFPGADHEFGREYRSTLLLPRPVMWTGAGPSSSWNVPGIVTLGELADWLEIGVRELEWFADCRGWEARVEDERLRQYRYRWVEKRSGGHRLLEIPKQRLKQLQRRILHEILDRFPPHRAAHAFRTGRTVTTYAAPHCGRRVVMRMDLADFFPSVPSSRVMAVFRTAGYPEAVARTLAGLCTNTVPLSVFNPQQIGSSRELACFRQPHLPQGAPTSPAIANLCAYRLDCRLHGLAKKFEAEYTRYADDLLFSGGEAFAGRLPQFRVWVGAIATAEGFLLRHRKTRVLPAAQRQAVAGLVLNSHANPPRGEYDALRALLFNCGRFGPAAQNQAGHPQFKEHLLGRIAWVRQINPLKADRLQRLFERIAWTP